MKNIRFIYKFPFIVSIYKSGVSYPAPSNLNYFWNFGIYALVCLVVQLITGIFLAMHYTPEQSLAFLSVEHIMRDVNYGWLLRYVHANGASMFFIVVYIHTFRGLYFSSYVEPRQHLWNIGVTILFLMILTAFIGYVLPWGQMSFWGATVITNLCSAIPKIGGEIVIWLWGGYSIDNATLNRFFSLHYLLPFVILGLVIVHLLLLHEHGSNNPIGVKFKVDGIYFFPYYIVKDVYGVILFIMFFSIFVFFMPNVLGHPDNYIEANAMVTPTHIVPEWYFLPFYAILRSIPDKLAGVLALLFAIICLYLVTIISKPEVRSLLFRPMSQIFFWFVFFDACMLGWIGNMPVEYPYVLVGQVLTVGYFMYFLLILPGVAKVEEFFWQNEYYLEKHELNIEKGFRV